MTWLRWLGGILVVGLIAWIVAQAVDYRAWRPAPQIVEVGSAFAGTTQLPKEEIERQIAAARDRMIEINSRGRWFSLAGDVASWLAFACTAAITLIAGYAGRAPAPAGTAPDVSGLPQKQARAIGLLAALSAVLTAGGSMAASRGHDAYDRATQAQSAINQATSSIIGAKTEREARDGLYELKLKLDRL